MKEILLKNLSEKIAGKKVIPVVDLLLKKKIVNENLISKKTKMPVNEIRNILYSLLSEGVVSFTRKKDKRKGWFVYFWLLNEEKSLLRVKADVTREIEELKKQLEIRRKERFYTCDLCQKEVEEETALEKEFVCSECASPYSLVDNSKIIEEIESKIRRKERTLLDIERELDSFKNKNRRKEKIRRNKKEIKKSKKRKR